MSFVTTENICPLTVIKASTWTKDRLGAVTYDDAGRTYQFVQMCGTQDNNASTGKALGWQTGTANSLNDYQVGFSTAAGISNMKFAGIFIAKSNADIGQKFWIMTRGTLGQVPKSKYKSAQTPLTVFVCTHTAITSGDYLLFSATNGYLASANLTNSASRIVGQSDSVDTGQKAVRGWIAAPFSR